MSSSEKPATGYCIYINTVCQGPVPVVRGEDGFAFIFPTLEEAQREIVDDVLERLRQFLVGERDFDDAITVEEYVVKVDVFPDGSILDEHNLWFGRLD